MRDNIKSARKGRLGLNLGGKPGPNFRVRAGSVITSNLGTGGVGVRLDAGRLDGE